MQTHPPHVMLIDDDSAVLGMVCDALTHYGMEVHAFTEAHAALELLEVPDAPQFDLVISDINMEGLDGFDVIHRVKAINPSLPVVLMTGQATLDYAIRAIRMGAANLFQKPLTLRELVQNVFHLVDLHREFRMAQAGLRGLVHESRNFSFRSDELDVPSLVKHLTDRLVPMGFAEASNVDVYSMAFHEALVNALEHGNLELDSSLKGDMIHPQDAYMALCQERMGNPDYASRRIDVAVDATPECFTVEITDEGHGFNTAKASLIDPDAMPRQCGRGLALIHMVMDEVSFNPQGNQIRMCLRRKDKPQA